MDTETVLAQMLPGVEQILKAVVEGVASAAGSLTLYALEERVQAVLAQVGHLVLQRLVDGQGSGAVGPERACACGGVQRYQDQRRPLSVQPSLGVGQIQRRASYRCAGCGARRYPLDRRLGLKGAGRRSGPEESLSARAGGLALQPGVGAVGAASPGALRLAGAVPQPDPGACPGAGSGVGGA